MSKQQFLLYLFHYYTKKRTGFILSYSARKPKSEQKKNTKKS